MLLYRKKICEKVIIFACKSVSYNKCSTYGLELHAKYPNTFTRSDKEGGNFIHFLCTFERETFISFISVPVYMAWSSLTLGAPQSRFLYLTHNMLLWNVIFSPCLSISLSVCGRTDVRSITSIILTAIISLLVWKLPLWRRCVAYNISYCISLNMHIMT